MKIILKNKILFIFLHFFILSTAFGNSLDQQVLYKASNESISNPERGYFHFPNHCDSKAFDVNKLKAYRSQEQVSLVFCMFYLEKFKNAPIDSATLNFFQNQMDNIRMAGLKVVLRFAYTSEKENEDAPLDIILSHIDQLAPVIKKNADVIAVVQQGFIGTWGEGAYSQNFGTGIMSAKHGLINLTEKNIQDRKTLLTKLLAALPQDMMVQVRTPTMKRALINESALSSNEAFNYSAKARVGHHNDCFLSSENDSGTYIDKSIDYPYLESETLYLPMGGETCAVKAPRSDCETALIEMKKFHWSYINLDFKNEVIEAWKTQGCFEQMKQKLGYRFVLNAGSYPISTSPGSSIKISFNILNEGFAAPFNPRTVFLVLINTKTKGQIKLPLKSDPRYWLPNVPVVINEELQLPLKSEIGTYQIFLELPDSNLSNRPEYSIRLSNNDMWKSEAGLNDLKASLEIK